MPCPPVRLTGERRRQRQKRRLWSHDWSNVCRYRRTQNSHDQPQCHWQQHRQCQYRGLQGPADDLPGIHLHHQPGGQQRHRCPGRQYPLPDRLWLPGGFHRPEHVPGNLQPHRRGYGLHAGGRRVLPAGQQGSEVWQRGGLYQAEPDPRGRLQHWPHGLRYRRQQERGLRVQDGAESGL